MTIIQDTHLDQKASQADVCNIQVVQIEKHNFQDCRRKYRLSRHNQKPKISSRITSRRHRLLVHHLHIYREGELGYSVNGINNKGVCMNNSRSPFKTIQNKTLHITRNGPRPSNRSSKLQGILTSITYYK